DCLEIGQGPGDCGAIVRAVAVSQSGDVIEEATVAQGDQDLDLVAELGAFRCGGTPRGGAQRAYEGIDFGHGIPGLLGGLPQAGPRLQDLVDSRYATRPGMKLWLEPLELGC